jgi:hypothetical protein
MAPCVDFSGNFVCNIPPPARRHDTQHNNIQRNDTQHTGHYGECHYGDCHFAERHFAECHCAECRYAECRVSFIFIFGVFMLSVVILSVVAPLVMISYDVETAERRHGGTLDRKPLAGSDRVGSFFQNDLCLNLFKTALKRERSEAIARISDSFDSSKLETFTKADFLFVLYQRASLMLIYSG